MNIREVTKKLDEELRKRDVRRASQLYSANSTYIYNGLYQSSKVQVAIKVQINLDREETNRCSREAVNQQAVPRHPNILQLFESFYFEMEQDCYVFVLLIEYVEKDLYKEITFRCRNSHPWTNEELMQIAKDLIAVLAMLQKQGVAHRDIKPQNLFIDSTLRVMLGDFGSSTSFLLISEFTIIGTPFYMSPELKRLLLEVSSTTALYSPVKSDVYSLGLTLLSMYKLAPPVTLANLPTLRKATESELAQITYSPLQALLTDMLQIKPEQRSDFLQLDEKLNNAKAPEPQHYSALKELVECEHIAIGAAVYFDYPCHGRFCQACIPAVTFLRSDGTAIWYQITCPRCFAHYDYGSGQSKSMPSKEEKPAQDEAVKSIQVDEVTELHCEERKEACPEELTQKIEEPEQSLCLQCKLSSKQSLSIKEGDEEIELECGHWFCSRQCFLNFYEFASHGYAVTSIYCPSCASPIPISLVESIFGPEVSPQEASSSPTLQSRICLTCRVNAASRQVHETHWYCIDCYTFLSQPKLFRCVECPDCLKTMSAERPRRSEKLIKEVQEPVVSGICCFKKVTYVKVAKSEEETDDGTVEIFDSSMRSLAGK